MGPAHLVPAFVSLLMGSLLLPAFGASSQLGVHNCARPLWLPSHVGHFEDSQRSAPEPQTTLICPSPV